MTNNYTKAYLKQLNLINEDNEVVKEDAKNRVFTIEVSNWPVKTKDERIEYINSIIRSLPAECKDIQDWFDMAETFDNSFKIYLHLPYTDVNEDELERKMSIVNSYFQNDLAKYKSILTEDEKATKWVIEVTDKQGNKLFVGSPSNKLTSNYWMAGVHSEYSNEYSIDDVKNSQAFKLWKHLNPVIIPVTKQMEETF